MTKVIETEKIIDDLTAPDVEFLFVALAPSNVVVESGHHFSEPGNKFYKLLKDVGFTDIELTPEDDSELLQYNIGITYLSLTAVISGKDELKTVDLSIGRLIKTIFSVQPEYVVFLGKRAFREFFDRLREYGLQQESIGNSKIFVLPEINEEDITTQKYDELKKYYEELSRGLQ